MEYTSEKRLASVIAEYEKSWREVSEESFQCRLLWSLSKRTAQEEAAALTCATKEATMTMTARRASKALGGLVPSPEIAPLVERTIAALRRVEAADVDGACGGFELSGSPKCEAAARSAVGAYLELDGVLDAWRPYLGS